MTPKETVRAAQALLEKFWDPFPDEAMELDLSTPGGRLLHQISGAIGALEEIEDAPEIDEVALAGCRALLAGVPNTNEG
jgi:hypothetical protein